MSDASCPFCSLDATRIFHAGRAVVGIWDGFPVSPGHALLIPKRHVSSWFDASDDERTELLAGIEVARTTIEREQPLRPDGYNIGINIDSAGGQTVPHLHVHLIPGVPVFPRG